MDQIIEGAKGTSLIRTINKDETIHPWLKQSDYFLLSDQNSSTTSFSEIYNVESPKFGNDK